MLLGIAFTTLALGPVPQDADVYYDELKTPHIYAESDEAAFYALGYQQMRDFPVKTLTTLFSVSGRMAEVAGIRFLDLDADVHHRDIGPKAAELAADLASTRATGRTDILALLEAYVAGVNAGRAWWLANPDAVSALANSTVDGTAMHIEPTPHFLNETSDARPTNSTRRFPDTDPRWTALAALERLLLPDPEEDLEVTVDHVLRVGIFLQLQQHPWLAFAGPNSVFSAPGEEEEEGSEDQGFFGSEGWMVTSDEEGTHTYSCMHVPFPRGSFYFYPIQIEAPTYSVSGIAMPGAPCVLVGFNEDVSWWVTNDSFGPFLSTAVGTTASVNGYYGNPTPVLHNQWQALVDEEIGENDLGFMIYCGANRRHTQCPYEEQVQIESDALALKYWDFAEDGLSDPQEFTREWVSEYQLEGVPRMPISSIPDDDGTLRVVDLDETVNYDQSPHALHTRSVWEFFIRVGRSPSIEGTDANCVENLITNEEMIIANDSVNFCAADDTGTFLYWLGGYVPRQGLDFEDENLEGIRPWLYPDRDGIQVFDGTLRRRYWRGLLPLSDLPNLVQSASEDADKIWIQNNATENFIERSRPSSLRLTNFPDYVTDHGNGGNGWGDRRQFDVENLLHGNYPITQQKNRNLALTKRDPWSIMYWPYFEEVIDEHGSSDAVDFADFINEWKNEEEDGTGRAGPAFIAHTASRTMPYLTLLQSEYERIVTAAFPGTRIPEYHLNLIFALDPYATKPAPAVLVASQDYDFTVDSMLEALDRVVPIWRNSGAAGGLCNHILLMTDDLDSITPGNINDIMQGDPPFVTEQPWSADIYDDDLLRWGHCQTLVATHHAFQGTGGAFANRLEEWRRSFYTSFWPEKLQDISSYEFKDHSHFTASRVAVWPIGGVNESVFASAARNGSYFNSVAGIEAGDLETARLYYLRIFSAGGPVVLSVDLGPQNGETANVGYYRALFGATEISADLSTWYAGQDEDDYYQAGDEYVDGTWTQLNVSSGGLGSPRHELRYDP